MIGRHFVLYSKDHIRVKRQYTICNAIAPKTYQRLLSILDAEVNKEPVATFANEICDISNTNSVFISCKDYYTKKGVATQLNRVVLKNQEKPWYVKGPLGMGLSVDPDGHNVVFAGGTGILCFLDLIAFMIL